MSDELQVIVADGLEALRRGDANRAFDRLSAAATEGADDRNTLLGLAIAARGVGRHEASLNAVERVLELDPTNLEALIIKADALTAGSERRRATAFYHAAVAAAPPGNQLPAPLAREIERARRECAAAAVRYEEFLRDRVNKLGIYDGSGRSRGEQALDVLFGRKQIYSQQPEKFFFPELPHVQFYNSLSFSWAEAVIAAERDIRQELDAVLRADDGFEPYVPANADSPHLRHHEITGNPDWGACHLVKDGIPVQENVQRCPRTMEALKHAPTPNIRGKSPIALFSRLKARAHIPPHSGLMNTRLICHLPIIAPEGCVLRVGNQERAWRIGEMLIFDDSIEHEARNNSSSERIVLLFDIWRPELSVADRQFVETVFDAIEDYGVF